jgi:predicted kinase
LERQAAAQLAATVPAKAWFIECACPREVALVRLAHRWRIKQGDGGAARPPATSRPGTAARDASDGRPELYDAQLAAWQPFDPATEPGLVHLRVNTQGNLAISVAQAVDRLGIEQLACWL